MKNERKIKVGPGRRASPPCASHDRACRRCHRPGWRRKPLIVLSDLVRLFLLIFSRHVGLGAANVAVEFRNLNAQRLERNSNVRQVHHIPAPVIRASAAVFNCSVSLFSFSSSTCSFPFCKWSTALKWKIKWSTALNAQRKRTRSTCSWHETCVHMAYDS